MKHFLLMIAVVALVGCGKKEPVQPSATKPEKETGKKATQPTTPDTEATKAKATAGLQLWEFKTGHWVFPPPPSDLMARFNVGSNDNKLYAIKTDSLDLAKSPWPMGRQNAGHTGRAPKKE